jgi:hypothetical protein
MVFTSGDTARGGVASLPQATRLATSASLAGDSATGIRARGPRRALDRMIAASARLRREAGRARFARLCWPLPPALAAGATGAQSQTEELASDEQPLNRGTTYRGQSAE